MKVKERKSKRTRILSVMLATVFTSSIFLMPTGNGMIANAATNVPYVVKAGDEKLAVVTSKDTANDVIDGILEEYTSELDKVEAVETSPKLKAEPATFIDGVYATKVEEDEAVKEIVAKNNEGEKFTVKAKGTVSLKKTIGYETKVKAAKSIAKGKTKVVRSGQKGLTKYVKAKTIVNGEVVSSKNIDRDVVKPSQDKLVYEGTFDGKDLVDTAKRYVGNPYVYGGNSLTNGTDCSGFVKLIYKKYGKSLPRTSSALRGVGKSVSYSDAKPGDLICYSGHVAIYAGNDKIVHAANPEKDICIGPAKYTNILSVRRVVS
ncbi:MAG: NlpC/P60 family protein [Anaerovoracaceae bacterium]